MLSIRNIPFSTISIFSRKINSYSNLDQTIKSVWKNSHHNLPPLTTRVLFATENNIHIGNLVYLNDEAHWATPTRYWQVKYSPYWMELPKHPCRK